MADIVATVDGVPLSTRGDVDGVRWRNGAIKGWYDVPALRAQFADRPSAAGSYYSAAFQAARVITVEGTLRAPDRLSLLRARDRLAMIGQDPDNLVRVQVDDDQGSTYVMAQRHADTLCDLLTDRAAQFSIGLTAPDPRRLAVDLSTAGTLVQSTGTGGMQWGGPDGSTGIRWGGPAGSTGVDYGTPGQAGLLLVDNRNGTAPADIVFSVGGPVLNPVLQRIDTGETIRFAGQLAAGSTLTIDTGSGAVLLGGIGVRPLLTRAEFFQVPPGKQIAVAYNSDSSGTSSPLAATWRVSKW